SESRKWLAQTERHVYWTCDRDGTITRIAKDGGVPCVIATNLYFPRQLVVHRQHLLWTESSRPRQPLSAVAGRVVRATLDGDDAEIVADRQHHPSALAARGDLIAWVNDEDYEKCSVMLVRAGGKPRRLASGQKRPLSIALSEDDVFWSTTGTNFLGWVDGTVV